MRTSRRAAAIGALVACLAGAVAVGGCFGSSPQPVYFTLEGGEGEVGPRAQTTLKLAVTRFDTRAPYDRSELVYRSRERELRYYPFDLWASKPGRMLSEAVTTRLRKADLFADVSVGPVVGAADYELRGEVVSVEERDVDAKTWQAHLAMRFELVSVDKGEVVLRHAFDRERPVTEHKVRAVAAALDAILASELDTLTTRIAEAVSRRGPP